MRIVRVICDVCRKMVREEVYESAIDDYEVDASGNLLKRTQKPGRHRTCQAEMRLRIEEFLKNRQVKKDANPAKIAAAQPS